MALKFAIIPVTPFRQNCTLLWDDDGGEAVAVDLGGDVDAVREVLDENHLTLGAVWLTHGHLDHAGGVARWLEYQKVPVIGPHRDDDFLLDKLPEITAAYGFPHSPPVTPDCWLDDGEVLYVGEIPWQVRTIPGHTPGHVVFYCEQAGLLIAGDVLFYESVGRTDFPRSNTQDLLGNIRSKLLVLPEDTRVIPGHGRMTTIGHEKRHNPYL